MPDIAAIISQGIENPWIYLPVALILGALHALEPGHSKSIMAAFLVATRGTWVEAIILGLSAAMGHTLIVWILVLGGIWLGKETLETEAYPWLVMISGVLILSIAARLFLQLLPPKGSDPKPDAHAIPLPQSHGEPSQGGHSHAHAHDHPHEHGHCGHNHMSEQDIRARYGQRHVTPFEIIWFGFTGGLLPCPSALAVLLVALRLKKMTLGAVMVGAFSLGLALTLVAIGLVTAWGIKKAKHLDGFSQVSDLLPRLSAVLVFGIGALTLGHGLMLLMQA